LKSKSNGKDFCGPLWRVSRQLPTSPPRATLVLSFPDAPKDGEWLQDKAAPDEVDKLLAL